MMEQMLHLQTRLPILVGLEESRQKQDTWTWESSTTHPYLIHVSHLLTDQHTHTLSLAHTHIHIHGTLMCVCLLTSSFDCHCLLTQSFDSHCYFTSSFDSHCLGALAHGVWGLIRCDNMHGLKALCLGNSSNSTISEWYQFILVDKLPVRTGLMPQLARHNVPGSCIV